MNFEPLYDRRSFFSIISLIPQFIHFREDKAKQYIDTGPRQHSFP
jgi:hypothetical protein